MWLWEIMGFAGINHSRDARSPSFEIGCFVHNLSYVEVARFRVVQKTLMSKPFVSVWPLLAAKSHI